MVTTVRVKDISYDIDLSLPPSGTLHTPPIYPERPKRKSRNNNDYIIIQVILAF